jgi:hypothetical protein
MRKTIPRETPSRTSTFPLQTPTGTCALLTKHDRTKNMTKKRFMDSSICMHKDKKHIKTIKIV